MHYLPVFVAASILLGGTAREALAQEPARPTLTITRFEGKLKSTRGADAAGDLADALASRVEESGCCRVMLRAWLPQATSDQEVPLTTVRAAAVAAGVAYVVSGRVLQSKTVRRPPAPTIGSVLGQMGPVRSLGPAGVMRGPIASRPRAIIPPPQVIPMVTLELDILDATDGKVLRTVNVTRPARDPLALVTGSSEVSQALVLAISSVARERR